MVTRGRTLLAAAMAIVGALVALRRADAHPLHTTITEVAADAGGGVRATVRVFADDLTAAVRRASRGRPLPDRGPAWDAAVQVYAASALAFRDARGRPIALRSCGIRREGALVWICIASGGPADIRALGVRNAMLCELYEDQVNVVQASVGTTRRSLLFVRGDGFKTL